MGSDPPPHTDPDSGGWGCSEGPNSAPYTPSPERAEGCGVSESPTPGKRRAGRPWRLEDVGAGRQGLDSVPFAQLGPPWACAPASASRSGQRCGGGAGALGDATGAAVPSSPLDGARRLGRARLAQQQNERGQKHGGAEQDKDDPGAEVCALAQRRRLGGDQVGQVQHVAERPPDRGVPGLRARGSASAPPRSPGRPRPSAPPDRRLPPFSGRSPLRRRARGSRSRGSAAAARTWPPRSSRAGGPAPPGPETVAATHRRDCWAGGHLEVLAHEEGWPAVCCTPPPQRTPTGNEGPEMHQLPEGPPPPGRTVPSRTNSVTSGWQWATPALEVDLEGPAGTATQGAAGWQQP